MLDDDDLLERVAQAIYAKGAYCGNCEYAGWNTCRGCRDCCLDYARAAFEILEPVLEGYFQDCTCDND